jgi:hypothetical protein
LTTPFERLAQEAARERASLQLERLAQEAARERVSLQFERLAQEVARQRTSLNVGLPTQVAAMAAEAAKRYGAFREPIALLESYRRAITTSFGSIALFSELLASKRAQLYAGSLGGLSESVRISESLRHSLGQTSFASPLAFTPALRHQLDALAIPKWTFADFTGPLGVDRSTFAQAVEAVVQVAASRARTPLASGLSEAARRELESALQNEDEVADVLAEVATAVQAAAAKQPKRMDWKFLLPIIIAVLMFLLQWQQGADIEEAMHHEAAEVKAKQDSIAKSLAALTAAVGRRAVAKHDTWLVAYPWANAARTAPVAESSSVIIMGRYRKWSLVLIEGDDSTLPTTGWIRQKYLRSAQPDINFEVQH